ncbi:MAG TPA: hypothetical protein VFB79_01565, partial [Candidatus Angelobacter sp.]|nr:hypothetical protein [Candidatus Angelobacter sp.]
RFCNLLPVLSADCTHPGVRTFVENKRQTPIRQGSHKAVDPTFLPHFDLESLFYWAVLSPLFHADKLVCSYGKYKANQQS